MGWFIAFNDTHFEMYNEPNCLVQAIRDKMFREDL